MQTQRLFEIVYILLDKKKVTARELAERLGVSRRTVLRDLETLALAKVPVCTLPGKGGGVSLLDGYTLDRALLSDEDRANILLGLKAVLPAGADGSALSRLGALLPAEDSCPMEVDYSRWSNPAGDRAKFSMLKDAVTRRRAIAFDYPDSAGNITERTALPLRLVFKGQAWYVQAYCLLRRDYRTFKINRMIEPRVLDDTFDASSYSPPPVAAEAVAPEHTIRIKAVFAPAVTYRVYDEFPPGSITRNGDGTFTIEVEMPFGEWVYGYLLSFGENVRIIEPLCLREELSEKIRKMSQNYSER